MGKQLLIFQNSYFYGFIGATVVVFLAWISASLINDLHWLTETGIQRIQVFSTVPGATALYGQRGWDIQTWGGETDSEKLNQKWFKIFSSIGFFLAVFAFQLKP